MCKKENSPIDEPLDIVPLSDVCNISDDILIARYFDNEKLKWLVENQTLWFSNSDNFTDEKERSIPIGFFENFKPEQEKDYKDLHDLKNKRMKAYISCWAIFDSENYALWKIYDRDSNGANNFWKIEGSTA